MKMKNKSFMGIAAGLLVVIIVLAVVCIKEYSAIQRNKVDSLNTAFYYMQEVLEEESDRGFENWDEKSANIYVLQQKSAASAKGMGDYEEISNMILEISQIENPSDAEAKGLIEQARAMKVSWSTGSWNWSASILNK